MLSFALIGAALAAKPAPPQPPPLFEDVAGQLLGGALTSDAAWMDLAHLATQIGARPAGSPALDKAITWAQEAMTAWGLANVHTEPATLLAWSRGGLDIAATAPFARPLHGLSLGGSDGTDPAGLEGDVVVVSSWDEFKALPDDRVKGRIVLWDVPFTTYGDTVPYRFGGASVASTRGAIASLVRSVTSQSLDTPHTGAQHYDDGVAPIPAIAITVEDAAWLHELQIEGVTPRVRLSSSAKRLPDVPSRNVMGEVRGRDKPQEVVILGCHLDSWDVGQGAQDDGAGCVEALSAVGLIARQPVPPRRTVRVVFYVGEEYGVGGAKAYAAAHAGEKTFAAIEADTGAGHPNGFHVDVRAPGETDEKPDPARVAALVPKLSGVSSALRGIDADGFAAGYAGTDIGPLIDTGVPGFGVNHDTTGYWPIHHTWADTLDHVDPKTLDEGVAAMAVLGWALADYDGELLTAPTTDGAK